MAKHDIKEIVTPDIAEEIGLDTSAPAIMLPGDYTRPLGMRCVGCNSPATVYYIENPMGRAFRKGSLCYPCLLKGVKASKMIPFPIEENLLNKLKHDAGIGITARPVIIQKGGENVYMPRL